MSEKEQEVRDSIPDRVLQTLVVDEVIKMLQGNDEAAYKVYLKLAIRFGAGQKL